jgi:hypothetical protein
MSTLWGANPTILACGHLCEPMAGIGIQDGERVRECLRCGTWERYVTAPDLDLTEDEHERWTFRACSECGGAKVEEPGEPHPAWPRCSC